MLFGLTPLGVVHTLLSLVALGAGAWALIRHRRISARQPAGRLYLGTTLLAAATSLGIFQHGGFGPPHALAMLTLLALGTGALAALTPLFGGWSRVVETVSFSSTVLFHLIPGVTESLTRLPPGEPVLPNADAPQFAPIYGVLLALFVVGLLLQLRGLRTGGTPPA